MGARTSLVLLWVTYAACGGCGDGGDPSPATGDGGIGANLETACPPSTPELNFGPDGLSSTPNSELGLKAHVVTASARPPLNGSNDWTIQITDLEGNPLPDANLLFACAYMPAHAHGSNPKTVRKLGDGKYELGRQNMGMEGTWIIRLWIDPSGSGTSYQGGRSVIQSNPCRGPTPTATTEFKTCVPG